jgi:short-subunit dehydrogenase
MARVAVISGGSQGIGRGVAGGLARRGFHVALLARRQALLDEAVAEIEQEGGSASAWSVDAADPKGVLAVCAAIREQHGPPSVVVHSAGGGGYLSIEETDAEYAVTMMNVRYGSAFVITRAFIDDMLLADEGHIVIIGSSYGAWLDSYAIAYTSAMHALYGLARSLKYDLRDTGIHVQWVEPPMIVPVTAYFENNSSAAARQPGMARHSAWTIERMVARILGDMDRRRFLTAPIAFKLMALFYWLLKLPVLEYLMSTVPPPSGGGPISGWRRQIRAGEMTVARPWEDGEE